MVEEAEPARRWFGTSCPDIYIIIYNMCICKWSQAWTLQRRFSLHLEQLSWWIFVQFQFHQREKHRHLNKKITLNQAFLNPSQRANDSPSVGLSYCIPPSPKMSTCCLQVCHQSLDVLRFLAISKRNTRDLWNQKTSVNFNWRIQQKHGSSSSYARTQTSKIYSPRRQWTCPLKRYNFKIWKYISSSNHQASVDIYVFKEWLVSSNTQQWQMKV